MNSLLLDKIKNISSSDLVQVRSQFSNSPLMLRFIQFLEDQKKDNFSTVEAVCSIYEIKREHPDFSMYENRFYKLRKKLQDLMRKNEYIIQDKLPPIHQQLQDVNSLIKNGKLKEAKKLLLKTLKHCWFNNIFESLPETIDQLILVNQSLNTLNQNKQLHEEYSLAITLYTDFMLAKNAVRKIYEMNLQQDVDSTDQLYKKLSKLVIKHRDFPRFKLLYNFVSAYYKTSARRESYLQLTHVTTRHISAAKKIMQQYPDMPAMNYTNNFQITQYYRLSEIQAFSYYNALLFQDAAEEMLELYNKVMDKDSKFSAMKNEMLFANAINIMSGASKFREALSIVEDYKEFLIKNKLIEKMQSVYYAATIVHTAMYPLKSNYETGFLLKQMDKYINKLNENSQTYGYGRLLKIKMLMSEHQFEAVAAELKSFDVKPYFNLKEVVTLTENVVDAKLKNEMTLRRSDLVREIRKARHLAIIPREYNWLLFLEKVVNNIND